MKPDIEAIFLDVGNTLRIVLPEPDFMAQAKKEGRAVAIGHLDPLTCRVLQAMISEIERAGIRLVFASEVVG